jgi:serine protease AprX
MKKFLPLFILGLLLVSESEAQFTRYLVKLKNKGGNPFSIATPSGYLSQRAIDRRTKYGIAIDSTDLPVTPTYVTQIDNVTNVTVLNTSKWLNSVSIEIANNDANAITTISGFSFVQSVSGLAARVITTNTGRNKFASEEITIPIPPGATQRPSRVEADFFNYGTGSFNEIHLHNGEFLHNIGLRGQGMQIAMLDGGFFNYTTLKAFDSVNINGQVLSTWDFVARHASVTEDNSHGMMCFSTIAANIPGQFIGKAPKASFHLFRTEEVATEYLIEEHNWACGAERADSVGSDIISSSLGYTTFDLPGSDHDYADRNGDIAMITMAADLAAKKGMLVFNAVGNIIDASTQFLSVPADGDSVVAVGSVNTSGVVAGNSSFGPAADGRIKPDVASVGAPAMVQATNNTVSVSNGTSFACPNMAGLTTCLWQGFPEYNNMKIVQAIRQAGSIFSTPNDRIGYGIPNMKLAFSNLLTEFATSAASVNACNVTVTWATKDVAAMKFEIERKAPGETVFTKIGELNPLAGSLLANHNYQFVNQITNGLTGNFSYRIRQIVDTATASFYAAYIDTAIVNVTTPGCFATGTGNPTTTKDLVMVQPNPVSGNIVTLVVETSYAITNMPVVVYDAKGTLVMQLKLSKGTGRMTTDLPVARLAKGKYFIKVLNAAKTIGTAELMKL